MDERRRLELQIQAISTTYAIEQRRLDSQAMLDFRRRGRELLLDLDAGLVRHPDLRGAADELRGRFDRDDELAALSLGEETIHRRDEIVEIEGLDESGDGAGRGQVFTDRLEPD